MSKFLQKIDSTCSFVKLVDSGTCVGDVLDVMEYNMTSLSNEIKTQGLFLNDALEQVTTIQNISAASLIKMFNQEIIDSVYKSAYTQVQKLSASWAYKEFSLYYPDIVDLLSYNSAPLVYNSEFLRWTTTYFSPEDFAVGQLLNVYVTFSYTNYFDFKFKGNYSELCAPTAHSNNVINCNGCGATDNRRAGCNHDQGHRHWCDNAYQYCKTEQIKASDTYSCRGYVKDTFVFDSYSGLYNTGYTGYLDISYEYANIEDKFISRVIKFKLQNNFDINGQKNWEVIV